MMPLPEKVLSIISITLLFNIIAFEYLERIVKKFNRLQESMSTVPVVVSIDFRPNEKEILSK